MAVEGLQTIIVTIGICHDSHLETKRRSQEMDSLVEKISEAADLF